MFSQPELSFETFQTLNERTRSGNGTIVIITSNAGGQAINKKLFDVATSSQSDGSELVSHFSIKN